jgi:hypothetical protein
MHPSVSIVMYTREIAEKSKREGRCLDFWSGAKYNKLF